MSGAALYSDMREYNAYQGEYVTYRTEVVRAGRAWAVRITDLDGSRAGRVSGQAVCGSYDEAVEVYEMISNRSPAPYRDEPLDF